MDDKNEATITFRKAKFNDIDILREIIPQTFFESLEIERIYLFAQFQNQGIGKNMLCKAVEVAKLKHKKQLWLGVWEENKHAIGFYVFGKHEFMLGNELQFDLLMKKDL